MAQDRAAFSIIDGAKYSLEQVQYLSSIDEDRPLGLETEEVQKFLFYWDQIFLYGLKSVKRGYWGFVSSFSHPSLVNEVRNTPGAVNDLLRGRLWLGTILNDNELENYLTLVQYEPKLLERFYRPHAIVRNRSHLEDLISISCGQENTLFSIHLDYICFRAKELFVGPSERSSFNKLFDIKFNWDESIRCRSSSSISSYSASSNFGRTTSIGNFGRTTSYSRSPISHGSNTLVGDMALKPDTLDPCKLSPNPRRRASHDISSISEDRSYIQFSPTAQLASSASASPSNRDLSDSKPIVSESPRDISAVSEPPDVILEEVGEMIAESPIPSPKFHISVIPVSPGESPRHQIAVSPVHSTGIALSPSRYNDSISQSSFQSAESLKESSIESRKDSLPETQCDAPITLTPAAISAVNSVSSTDVTPSGGLVTPSRGLITPSRGLITPSQGLITPSRSPEVSGLAPVVALCPGDQLALSPRNQEVLDEYLQLIKPAEDELDINPFIESDDDEEDDDELAFEEEEQFIEVNDNLDIPAQTIAEFVVNEVIPETPREPVGDVASGGKEEGVVEELYSDSDISLQDEEQDDESDESVHMTLGSDPYLVGSDGCSPTLLVTDVISKYKSHENLEVIDPGFVTGEVPLSPRGSPKPSSSAWYEPQVSSTELEKSATNFIERGLASTHPETVLKDSGAVFEESVEHSSVEHSRVHSSDKASTQSGHHLSEDPASEELYDSGRASFSNKPNTATNDVPRHQTVVREVKEEEQPHIELPDFSFGSMDRELGIVTPTQNQKISWAMELFGDNEDLCFMYRVWLKDDAGNLEPSYFLLTTQMIYLLDPQFLAKHRVKLDGVSYGRGMNWQIITLFVLLEDGTTDQIDVISGCEAISRGIMEGLSVNPHYPVDWAVEDSYSQMRLKYHANTFLQERGSFDLSAMDDMYYGVVSWLSLTAPPPSALKFPISEGKMWLKEPTYLSYVWRQYYFILDKQGKLSQFDTECGGAIKKQYTVIGSFGCRRMTKRDTTKQFAFKFTSEEGTEVMLNCDSALARDRWMTAISKMAMEIPQNPNETGFGIQCSAVVNSKYILMVREGLKSSHTLDSALIQDITDIRWNKESEMCVVVINKREWLLLFRDNYETNKFMECIWERWCEVFQCDALQLLFTHTLASEMKRPLEIMKSYKDYISGVQSDIDNSEFECL